MSVVLGMLIFFVSALGPASAPSVPALDAQRVRVRVTYYNPALGGLNCASFVEGQCVSRTASGERWQDWIDNGALACPPEFPLWSTWTIAGQRYVCIDRGGWVYTQDDGVARVDILASKQPAIAGYVWDARVEMGTVARVEVGDEIVAAEVAGLKVITEPVRE